MERRHSRTGSTTETSPSENPISRLGHITSGLQNVSGLLPKRSKMTHLLYAGRLESNKPAQHTKFKRVQISFRTILTILTIRLSEAFVRISNSNPFPRASRAALQRDQRNQTSNKSSHLEPEPLNPTMPPPVDRSEAELKGFAAKYTLDDLETFEIAMNQDKRTEHRDFCDKARLPNKQCFATANYTAPGSNIETVESHQGSEKLMEGLLINHGVGKAFLVYDYDQPYAPAVDAVEADPDADPPVIGVEARDEINESYTTRAFFGETERPITFEDVKRTSTILSCHAEPKYAIANTIGTNMVLNQCKPDLRKKIETELGNLKPQERGGIVAMYLVRQTIANSSVECSEVIREDLKKYALNQVKGENVEEAVRVIKSNYQILVAGEQVPPKFVEHYAFRIFQSSSTEPFNEIFKAWLNQCTISGEWPNLNEVCQKALKTYTDLVNRQLWKGLGTPARAAAAITANGETTPTPPSSTDGSSKKKTRMAAANANDTPTEKIREFTFDGSKVKGNIAPPAEADKTKPRKFEKLDGTGSIELWHCNKCGAGRNGMWKKHHTANHPTSNASPTSTSQGTASESSRHVTFSETASTFVMPTTLDRSGSESS